MEVIILTSIHWCHLASEISSPLVQVMNWSPFHTNHYLSKWWLILTWSSDTKRLQRSASTLAQVMACFLTAPSHYLNQCRFIISKVPMTFIWWCHQLWKLAWKLHLKFHSNLPVPNKWMSAILLWPQCVKWSGMYANPLKSSISMPSWNLAIIYHCIFNQCLQ